MRKQKIANEGFEGSFHHQTTHYYFGEDMELLRCDSFYKMERALVHDDGVDAAVMAIENSLAGSISPNFSLPKKADLQITGRAYLCISRHLLAFRGIEIEDRRVVDPHPMTLYQCEAYFYPRGWKPVETEDTALSTRHPNQYPSPPITASARVIAARLFRWQIRLYNAAIKAMNTIVGKNPSSKNL